MIQSTISNFPIDDYRRMLETRHTAARLGFCSMEPWPPNDAARLMAIVQVFGNNEGFTLSPKFNADREYIQRIYGIEGGRSPDPEFSRCLVKQVRLFENAQGDRDIDFRLAQGWIRSLYNFELLR